MCKKTERKTKKVYRMSHAENKAKAYKRDMSKNKSNLLNYVRNSDQDTDDDGRW